MEGNATGKPFKMKGHSLPGINQRLEGNTNLPDGRSRSAAFQYKSPAKDTEPHTGLDPDHGAHEIKEETEYTPKQKAIIAAGKKRKAIDKHIADNPDESSADFNAWLTGYMKLGNE